MSVKLEPICTYIDLKITDKNVHMGTHITKNKLSQFKELVLVVYSDLDNSSHNVNPVIKAYDHDNNVDNLIVEYLRDISTYNSERIVITKEDWYGLGLGGIVNLNIGVVCTNTPTSGNITVDLYGVRN